MFVSSRSGDKVLTKTEPRNHLMVAQCLTRSFEKAEVFKEKDSFTKVSCSRLRFSIITELICLGTEKLENIAHCFAKHGKKVCKHFSVQFWNNREAVRLSWKCHNMFRLLSDTDKQAVEQRESVLSKKALPTSSDIQRWYDQKRNLTKVTSRLDARDEGLENMIKSYSNERLLKDDGN